MLNEADRNKNYRGAAKCDSGLAKAWYRFVGAAGRQMPTQCVPVNRCGTSGPGWLTGGHPTVGQGAVQRLVCFHLRGNCCQRSLNIRVQNCGAFFVYELSRPPACPLRFCGDNGSGKPG